MTGLINTLRAAGILVVGGIAAALLFAVLGSLLVAAGVFVSVLVVAGGLHYLVFGRKALVETRVYRSPTGNEMIDITPPRPPKRR